MGFMQTILKWSNLAIFFWFLFFFQPHWLGWILSVVIGYRLLKQWWNPRKGAAFSRLIDCSYQHTHDDGHKHVGKAPDGKSHNHTKRKPNLRDQHNRNKGHPHLEKK